MRNSPIKIIYLLFIVLIIGSVSCDQLLPPPTTVDGEWKCEENHQKLGESSYYVYIEYVENDSSQIRIYNFLGLDNTSVNPSYYATARVQGDRIILNKQTLMNAHQVEGSGDISSDYRSISWSYTHDDGDISNVTAKYTLVE